MRERIPIYHSMTLENCADYLLKTKLDYTKNYYNIKIDGNISSEPIREMVHLPYEITLYHVKDENRLMTGTRYAVSEEYNIVSIMKRSLFNLHTHPSRRNAKFDAPSFADLLSIPDFWSNKIRAIAHTDGLLIYGNCKRDLENKLLSYKKSVDDEYLEDMVCAFLKKKKITLFDSIKGYRKIENLSLELQSKYQKEFTILTRLIKDEAFWNEKKDINRIMKKIFGAYSE